MREEEYEGAEVEQAHHVHSDQVVALLGLGDNLEEAQQPQQPQLAP